MTRQVVGILALCAAAAAVAAAAPAATGTRVPVLRLTAPRTATSIRFPARGRKAVVVCFIALQGHAGAPTGDSRGEATVLLSLQHQYAKKGLQIVLIGTALEGRPQPTTSRIVNATYDWRLGSLPLLADPVRRAAVAYHVLRTPTTDLLDAKGQIVRRWSGFVAPGPLALAVQAALNAR